MSADGASASATLAVASAAQPALGADAERVVATVNATCPDIVRVTLRPAGTSSHASELPGDLLAGDVDGGRPCAPTHTRLAVSVSSTPFGVAVTRNATTLFNSTSFRLLLKPRFLELTTSLPSTATVFGLGERTASLAVPRSPTPRALYSRDAAAYVRDQNLYGAWPLAIVVDEDGAAHSLLIASAAPLDVVTQTDSLTIRLLAPTATMFILGGPSVTSILDAATRITGRPALPPAWALGAMQSKWGWTSLDDVEASVDGYDAENIPLDTVFADINYMSNHRDFTFNETAYPLPRVRAFVGGLHAAHRHWVPILDPGIPAVPGFHAYDVGVAVGVFVRAPPPESLDTPYIGTVWPGAVAWPDFAGSPSARAYWASAVASLHARVSYDGLWIDMNEASNFDTAEAAEYFSPYCVNNGGDASALATRTIPPLARSSDGTPHASRHNLYGLAEAVATLAGLKAALPFPTLPTARSSCRGRRFWGRARLRRTGRATTILLGLTCAHPSRSHWLPASQASPSPAPTCAALPAPQTPTSAPPGRLPQPGCPCCATMRPSTPPPRNPGGGRPSRRSRGVGMALGTVFCPCSTPCWRTLPPQACLWRGRCGCTGHPSPPLGKRRACGC